MLVLTWTDQRRKLVPGPIAWHSHHTAPLTESCGMGTDGCTVFSKSKNTLGPNALFHIIMIGKIFKQLTLIIMSELIINSKLATAGPRHFDLQKYPPKRKLYEKIAVSSGI